MSRNPPTPDELPTEAAASLPEKYPHPVAVNPLPPGSEAATTPGQPAPVNSLSPEEQMALFEKELKEKDWGHQPC